MIAIFAVLEPRMGWVEPHPAYPGRQSFAGPVRSTSATRIRSPSEGHRLRMLSAWRNFL